MVTCSLSGNISFLWKQEGGSVFNEQGGLAQRCRARKHVKAQPEAQSKYFHPLEKRTKKKA